MGDSAVFTPDVAFVRSLKEAGADTLKKCYQCATCSVVCELSPDDSPFPRKEMLMAQWGLKEELAKDPDVWLCHNCNDCSKYCPRGARPGDVFSVLRQMTIRENAVPGFLADIVGNPSMILVALAIPIILFLVIIGALGRLTIPAGPIIFTNMMPVPAIDAVFITAALLVTLSFALSIKKFWAGLNSGRKAEGPFIPALIATIMEIVQHKKFEKCGANKDRAWAHRFVFYGFIGLFITTNWAVFYLYALGWESPYGWGSPHQLTATMMTLGNALKIFGNASALTLLIGALLVIANRMKDKGVNSKSSSFDWVFAIIVLLVCVTGILSEVLRLANIAQLAYPVYFVHLVFVFYIIAYLPFSKLAHLVYRTTAITYAKMAKRDAA